MGEFPPEFGRMSKSWGDTYLQKPVAMSLADANRLLGGPHSTPEAVRAGFAKAVKAAHPDTAGDPGSKLGASIETLKLARDVLLDCLNQGQEITCKLCGGSGRVGVGFGTPCAACHGKGVTNG